MEIIHQKLAEAAGLIENKSPYCKFTPTSVLENGYYPSETGRSSRID